MTYALMFLATCALFGAAFWPHIRRTTTDIQTAMADAAQESHGARLLTAIAADDVDTVAALLDGIATLPDGAWAAAVQRAHPVVVRLLLPLADPCAALNGSGSGVHAVYVLGAVIHTGGRADHGVGALRVVLDDPRVTADSVLWTLSMWCVMWCRSMDGNAERLAALLAHPSLSARTLADNPESLTAVEELERGALSGRPSAAGHIVNGPQAFQLNRRAAEARTLAKADRAKIVVFRRPHQPWNEQRA